MSRKPQGRPAPALAALVLSLTLACACLSAPAPNQAETAVAGEEPPVSTDAQYQGSLVALQQSVLYDRRGGPWDNIMEYHQLMLVNHTSAPVGLQVSRRLDSQELQKLDLQSFFPFMSDLAPAGLKVPVEARIRRLPSPARDGDTLRWQEVTLKVGEACLACYSGHFCSPASLVQGGTVNLPLTSVTGRGGRSAGSLSLQYALKNTLDTTLKKLSLAVFLPAKVPSQKYGVPDTPLYETLNLRFNPQPQEQIGNTMTTDGNLTISEGVLARFFREELAPAEEAVFSIEADIRATGRQGECAPFVHLGCYAHSRPSSRFEVQVSSPPGLKPACAPDVRISNVGWPDTTRFEF